MLVASNVFMTIAWYWHLKEKGIPLWKAIILSWGIAFFEYCLTVPANRYGYTTGWNAFQLKIAQEVITLVIFSFFAVWYEGTLPLEVPSKFCVYHCCSLLCF
jgi:uncharacterized protein (DUF486 family)